MATVDKNFRIKNGLAVEGSVATVNGNQILTENASDTYILNLIGGETLVKSVASGLSVDVAGELSINRTVVDGWYDESGAASDAQAAAESYADGLASNYDPAGSAASAETNANNYTNTQLNSYTPTNSLDTTVGGYGYLKFADLGDYATEQYADNAAAGALTDAQTYADNKIDDTLTVSTKTWSSSKISSEIGLAQTAAQDYADGLINDTSTASDEVWSAYKTSTEIGLAQTAAQTFATEAIADVVGLAPAALDTLVELAAAFNNEPDTLQNLITEVGTKQDSLTAGSNIDITGSTISVTGLNTADVAEDSSRLYFTDSRAKDAVSAALGEGIEYIDGAFDVQVGTGLEIDVNNAVKINRTTVDAWYDAAGDAAAAQTAAETTAQNALNDVLDGTTPFTDLNINDVAKQVAARTTSLGSVVVTAYQFNKSTFKSGKFLVKIDNGTHNEISEILVTLDSSDNVAITEYAIVGTNGTRGTITADVDATHCRIRVNPVNDSTITVSGTVFKA